MATTTIPDDSNEQKFPTFEPRLSITERSSSIPIIQDEKASQYSNEKRKAFSNIPSRVARTVIPRSSYFSLFTCLETRHDKALLALGVILAVAAGAPLPVIGLLFSQIIDTFPPPADQLRTKLYELIGVACIYFVLTWGWCVCWGLVGERVSRNRREALVKSVVGMEMATFDTSAPDIATSLTADCQLILLGTSEKVGLFIQSISYFVATIIVGFILNATLTGILLAAVVPSMAIVIICGSSLTSKWAQKAATYSEEAAKVSENAIGSVKIVQAYDIASTFLKRHETLLNCQVKEGIRKSIVGATMLGCVYFVCYSTNALAFFEGNRLDGDGGAGKVYAIVFLLLDATFVIGMVGPFIQTLTMAGAAAERISSLIKPPADIDVYSDAGIKADSSHLRSNITLHDVSFTYPARDDAQVLDHVSMTFAPGTFSALVGLSGSGKSTVASLLLRLYDPDEGQIFIDGVDMKVFNVASLRSHVALVDQDSVLFEGTILQNISQGLLHQRNVSPEAAVDMCLTAVEEANCDFVRSLPQGIHTKVGGSDGVELSGGQCQRISLARALVRRPALLILDEPTSALDARSERLIMQSLNNAAKTGITIIMIAHRLSTISHADNILVMESGKVVEQGNHEQLVLASGLYAQLLSTQQAGSGNETPNISPLLSTDSVDTIVDDGLGPVSSHKTYNVDIEATSITSQQTPEQKLSTRQILGRVWSFSRRERPFIFMGILASITSGALIIGEAFIFGHLVAALNDEANQTVIVHFYCLMFFVLGLIALLAYSVSGSCFGFVSERLVARVQNLSLKKILNQDQAFFSTDGHGVHQLTASMKADCGSLAGLSGVIIGTICSITTSMLGGIILAHVVAWKIAIVLLAAVPVMMFACYLRLSTSAKFEQRHKSAYNGAAALATEACKGIRTVAAYGLEHDILKRYRECVQKPYDESTRNILAGNLILAMSYSITYFVYALAYWWGATQVRSGMYSQLQFFIVLPALLFSAQTSGQLFSMSPELTRAKVAAQSVFNLLDTKPTIITEDNQQPSSSSPLPSSPSDATTLPPPILTFTNVSLTYPSQPKPILHDMNLTIFPGEFIGIVGPSGAGKSSLVSLLGRFCDPTSGTLTSNSSNIATLPVQSYRSQISLVPQAPALFSGSIAFNIALGAQPGSTASQADIEAAARKANIHDFLTSLPSGYQTECGANGSQLSGGQKQRIAIARALIRDPKILLLDEATASLDARSEREVLDAVAEARNGRTVVMVTHRLCGVVGADRIVVMDEGRVVQVGTHAELVRVGGLYAVMARSQGLV